MKETKEDKKVRKEKHKEKSTKGDIIFRILILVSIFFIALIFYMSYLNGITQ